MAGKLYLIPNTLDLDGVNDTIPKDVQTLALSIKHYIVENEKVARRFLKRMDRNKDINECRFYPMGKHASADDFPSYIRTLIEGNDMGMISDAGCPAVADPGHLIVSLAHRSNITVVPLTGPSSIIMALMASGMNGQHFQFHGYLPHDKTDRTSKIKAIEREIKTNGATQLFMDTPFRNNKLLQEVIQTCHPTFKLCVAASITSNDEHIITKSIADWRKTKYDYHKIPIMICMGR